MRVWKPEEAEEGKEAEETMAESSKKRKAREDKAARKKARAEEKHRIMEELPKVDEHGIAYTKQQLRRMRKRVARGLNPVETPAEANDRKVRKSQIKKEAEAELAGLDSTPDVAIEEQHTEDEDHSDNGSIGDQNYEDDQEEEEDDEEEEGEEQHHDDVTKSDGGDKQSKTVRSPKKKRSKPVPDDYICSACKNAIAPAHWIYDCPQKKTLRGTNQKSKKLRGLHDPAENKLFVSGLPFETTVGTIKKLFESKSGITPTFVKLIKFKDSDRCRGQAYLSFASANDAKKAQGLDGTLIPNTSKSDTKKKDLKLIVCNVLNRFVTTKQPSK